MSKKPKIYDFSGWATKNDLRCSDGRTIRRDAFKDDDGRTVPLVWMHQHDDPENVLGHAVLENREEGMYAYCSFNDTHTGKQAKEIVKHGDVCSLSIWANNLKHQRSQRCSGRCEPRSGDRFPDPRSWRRERNRSVHPGG